MALFHFHAAQVKRSAGHSAVGSASYRAGEKLFSEFYGEIYDYTHKGGVICSEIFLPSHAPPEYADRQTLWNAVENAEHGKKAQLAYSFDIALQNEFSMEENIALARQFVSEQFVSRGMVADVAVHQPDKEDEGIQNPHFHVLCPIRPLDEDGEWGKKQRRVYRLDEDGERIKGEDGKDLFDAVPTTDWGKPETLEAWRQAWAELCNAKFAEKGLDCRIDNRSYLRQGLDLLPTVHEGVNVCALEKKGIQTEKGELNRWIRSTNAVIKSLHQKIADLSGWLDGVREELSKPPPRSISELLGEYYGARNAGAYSMKAKTGNLKKYADSINYLSENGIYTVDDLQNRVNAHSGRTGELKKEMDRRGGRMKELQELIRHAGNYASLKPVNDELEGIRFKGRREAFSQAHESDLRLFRIARRKLEKHFSPDGKLPVKAWKQEYEKLRQENDAAKAEYKVVYDDLMKLLGVKACVDNTLRREEQTRAPQTRQYITDRGKEVK